MNERPVAPPPHAVVPGLINGSGAAPTSVGQTVGLAQRFGYSHGLMPETQDYKVDLDVYSGPLDLLLYLIRKEEVNIRDIPIARITEQYLHHVAIISRLDINLAGEFLVMAATLMEIKSRMLIPRPVVVPDPNNPEDPAAQASMEDLADPRAELVRQLLAYKSFKDAATDLRRRATVEADRFARAVPKPAGRPPLDIEDLNLFALIDAFSAIMASIGHSAYGHEVVYDDTPISLHQADILDRLQRQDPATAQGLSLQDLFVGRTKKTELIGLFLATLELIKLKKIFVEQFEPLGEVRIRLRTDAVAEETALAAQGTLDAPDQVVPPVDAADAPSAADVPTGELPTRATTASEGTGGTSGTNGTSEAAPASEAPPAP